MSLSAAIRALTTGRGLLAGAAALAGLAMTNAVLARRAERRHPPKGRFMTVDGVRLHYTDSGRGQPVLLVHGNAVSGEDYETSGLAARLRERHRVIIIDRPGFGHSERPRGRLWTAMEQAALLNQAMHQIGVERPIVVGHSWGAIVALSLAVQHPVEAAGLVLLSGYYHWTLRPDVLLVVPGAMPVLGDLLRYTVSPLLGRLLMPLLKRGMFSPAPIPVRFRAEYSDAMALRPSQIRATSSDGALMIPGALQLRGDYATLQMPVAILAGEGDKVVFAKRAKQLHAEIPGSTLQVLRGVGHMVHHSATEKVAAAVERIAAAALPGSVPAVMDQAA